MLTLDQYIDLARAQGQYPSDSQLALALGLNPSAISQMRTKRILPSDATMIRLAEKAGLDVQNALIDLNLWRASSEEVKSVYSKIRDKVSSAAAVLILVLFTTVLLEPNQAIASERTQNSLTSETSHLYIMRLSICCDRIRFRQTSQ